MPPRRPAHEDDVRGEVEDLGADEWPEPEVHDRQACPRTRVASCKVRRASGPAKNRGAVRASGSPPSALWQKFGKKRDPRRYHPEILGALPGRTPGSAARSVLGVRDE